MEKCLEILQEIWAFAVDEEHILDVITLIFAVIGGLFALSQWNIQIKHKRAEIVKELINKVRDDADISAIMDCIDWDRGLKYRNNGKFCIEPDRDKDLQQYSEDVLFRMVDATLCHYAYICYLKKRGVLRKKDISTFQYDLRRLTDNREIANYLYTIYHWSRYLGVKSSFDYLIRYAIKRRYFSIDFFSIRSRRYWYHLPNPKSYSRRNLRNKKH